MSYSDRTESSPDGRFRFEFVVVPGRMSHEIHTPRLVEVATGRVLFDLTGSDWDLSVSKWESSSVFTQMRSYSGGGLFRVEFDLSTDLVTIEGREPFPVAEISQRLESALGR
jgi:hypothetical protein